MKIVGRAESEGCDGTSVHTIDVWFSRRRQAWCIERLDADGHQIGLTHCCVSEGEAAACVDEWLRTHAETELVTPNPAMPSDVRRRSTRPHRRAA